MQEWFDTTLIAIHWDGAQFKVLELPARQARVITSKKSFPTLDRADMYISEQYSGATAVPYEDIQAEAGHRKEYMENVSYTLVCKPFREKEQKTLLGAVMEEEALNYYESSVTSFLLGDGGYVLLYQGRGKYPVRAVRVGYERY
jgi:hypothetical protein